MQHWYVYLMRCADDSLYCGITTDIDRRLKEHNAGTASKYTRPRRPVKIAACGKVSDKSSALKLEIEIKKQHRNHKIGHLKASTNAVQ